MTRLKKTLILAMVACCVPWSRSERAQSADKTQPQQTRQVKGQVLTSTYMPAIRIKFDDDLKYAGTQKFILYERAQVEQYFFVAADSEKRIARMYMIQFEGYLPNIDAAYSYPVNETVTLGGQTYIVNTETVPNVSAVLKQDPQSDAARAASFLGSKGYRLGESIRFQRFVRLLDEAKRNELLLLYIEDASDSKAKEKTEKEFSARALKALTIL